MTGFPNLLLMVWGALTVVLAGLLMWRYLAGFREENVLSLDSAAASMAAEQREVTARVVRINSLIKVVGGVWLLAATGMVAVWCSQAWVSFNGG